MEANQILLLTLTEPKIMAERTSLFRLSSPLYEVKITGITLIRSPQDPCTVTRKHVRNSYSTISRILENI
jgi:hypothetical protein